MMASYFSVDSGLNIASGASGHGARDGNALNAGNKIGAKLLSNESCNVTNAT